MKPDYIFMIAYRIITFILPFIPLQNIKIIFVLTVSFSKIYVYPKSFSIFRI